MHAYEAVPLCQCIYIFHRFNLSMLYCMAWQMKMIQLPQSGGKKFVKSNYYHQQVLHNIHNLNMANNNNNKS